MTIYARARAGGTWHWCRNCTEYPSKSVEQRTVMPVSDLCNQCLAKERAGDCRA